MANDPILSRQVERLSLRAAWAQTGMALWLIGALIVASAGSAGAGWSRYADGRQAEHGLRWVDVSRARLELLRSVNKMQRDLLRGRKPTEVVAAYAGRRDSQIADLQRMVDGGGEVARAADALIGAANAVPDPENPSTFGVHVASLMISVQIGALSRQTSLEGELAFPDAVMVELSRLQALGAMVMSLRDAAPSDDMLALIGSANASSLFPIQGPVGSAFSADSVPAALQDRLEEWLESEDTAEVTAGADQLLHDTRLEGLTIVKLDALHASLSRSIDTATGLADAALTTSAQNLEQQMLSGARHARQLWIASVVLALLAILVVALRRSRTQRVADDLRVAASTDGLTGLANRAHLEEWVAELNAEDRELVLMHVDLDHFKPINDTYGHAVGDRVLQIAAQRLRQAAEEHQGLAARLGGDEFVVVFPELDQSLVDRISHRLVAQLASYEVGGLDIRAGASIGVARGRETLQDLLIDADLALYQAKRTGRGQAATFQDEAAAFVDFVRQEVEAGRVQAVFQPQFSLRDGRCVGAEVYARIADHEGILLQADEWMGVVEWMGWTAKLFEHLVTDVARQIATQASLPPRLWLNVTPTDLMRPSGAEWLLENLGRLGLPPESVGVELTNVESVGDLEQLAKVLRAVREVGYGVALDDFGRDSAPLGHLRDLPATRVKLDRSLVAQVSPETPANAWMVRSLADLGRQLRIEVVAEGVSSGAQLVLLARLGVPTAQGYLLGLPGPLDRIPLGLNLRQLVGANLNDLERRADTGVLAPPPEKPGAPTQGNDRRRWVRSGPDRRRGGTSGAQAASAAGSRSGTGTTPNGRAGGTPQPGTGSPEGEGTVSGVRGATLDGRSTPS